jgi:hypothetical protein
MLRQVGTWAWPPPPLWDNVPNFGVFVRRLLVLPYTLREGFQKKNVKVWSLTTPGQPPPPLSLSVVFLLWIVLVFLCPQTNKHLSKWVLVESRHLKYSLKKYDQPISKKKFWVFRWIMGEYVHGKSFFASILYKQFNFKFSFSMNWVNEKVHRYFQKKI